jgi:hypothetical protein
VSADQDHNNVIEVQFKDNDNYNALVHFAANTTSETLDMSAYATGKLMFDIKLVNVGKFSPQLNVMMECVYPCISHDHHISFPALNQWTSVEVPIAEFIEGGMDISKTSIGFQIVPEWNKQSGVQFQIDNIRWIKGTGTAPAPETHCYEQRFETWSLPYRFNTLVGSPNLTSGALTKIISTSEITPNWSSTTDKFGYAPKVDLAFSPCEFTDGKLSAQVYLPKSYVEDGKMRVGFYYEDSSSRRAYFPPVNVSSMKADAWTTISTPLVTNTPLFTTNNAPAFSNFDASFDIYNINYAGIYFDANGKNTTVGGTIKVDNIFTSGKHVTPNMPGSVAPLCDAGKQEFRSGIPLGINVGSGQHFFVRTVLSNAILVGKDQTFLTANTSSFLVQSTATTFIFEVTANDALTASQNIFTLFDFQVTDPNQTVSVDWSIHATASDAVNASNKLSSNKTNLVSGVSCSSSSQSSSITATSSSSLNSSQAPVSSASSSASSLSSSSSKSSSSSSSSSNSACSISAKVDNSSPTLGFGLASGSHGYLVIKLSNAEFVSPSTQVSLANAFTNLASGTNSKVVFDITATDNLPSSTPISVSFGFQQTAASSAVTREISIYSTLTTAMNDSLPLSSSSAQIAGPSSCN